ncbi:DUF302 domain-containing protein [Jannaschia sp. CCS1]|uniref:DUF302 domain-containing protein n=1 Tax=Jannaschia sp. (strain CCS1) TaxID=290400 RepID=UPI000053AD9F|nr:DUF302 domain-containing protein [Jannaschia sp. CCS1]ABD55243.1 hypothetical protein Jann_2326 [Jannaschia sp. CCS1]
MLRALFALVLLSLSVLPQSAAAQDVADLTPLPGWEVVQTTHDFETLVERTRAAVSGNGLAVVTRAGPTGAAANRGITIPGNMVVGAFNNVFAVRILSLSTEAMIHAPIRLYVTENADGSATLSYIRPSTLFAPYVDDAGPALAEAAAELDTIFAAIAQDAAAL